ncbi:hypothetical protein [Desulfonema magnum]|uniref:Flagellar assembly protein T N-terminal domain-containing protein n=1 Tax=Desulfonema magnum TaxID=45655 RepID=A0A975BX18_9BACT|nr:hypothetical protein [Desulfonema magnum]QTA93107.1 Uncharacterized protein dnm_092040 [Desulfonema magnum]
MFCSVCRLCFSILVVAGLMILSDPALAQDFPSTKTVTVIGTSPIRGQNVAKAREQAISDALASAVDLAALNILPSDIFSNNFEILNEILCDHPDKFVRNYKVLAESDTGKTYRIMLETTVQTDRIEAQKRQLAAIDMTARNDVKKPLNVLFLIAEQNLNNSPQYWWGENMTRPDAFSEKAMAKIMEKKGFIVVPHGYRVSDTKLNTSLGYKPDLDNQEAMNIAKRLQADVVIVGKSIVYNVSNTSSFSGTVSARAIRTDTGEEITSTLQTSVKVSADEISGARDALSSSGTLAGKELSSQISAAWHKSPTIADVRKTEPWKPADVRKTEPWKPADVRKTEPWKPDIRQSRSQEKKTDLLELIVSGTSQLGNFIKFRRTLTEIPEVEKIQIREMKSDEATIHVSFQGNTGAFEDALRSKTFELFRTKFYRVSDDILRVELISK